MGPEPPNTHSDLNLLGLTLFLAKLLFLAGVAGGGISINSSESGLRLNRSLSMEATMSLSLRKLCFRIGLRREEDEDETTFGEVCTSFDAGVSAGGGGEEISGRLFALLMDANSCTELCLGSGAGCG